MKANNNTCNVYANEETLRLENIGGGSFQMFNDKTGNGYTCMKTDNGWEIVRLKRVRVGYGNGEGYAWHANGINPDRRTFTKGGEAIEYINNNL